MIWKITILFKHETIQAKFEHSTRRYQSMILLTMNKIPFKTRFQALDQSKKVFKFNSNHIEGSLKKKQFFTGNRKHVFMICINIFD